MSSSGPEACMHPDWRGKEAMGGVGGGVNLRQSAETQFLNFLCRVQHGCPGAPLLSPAGGFLLRDSFSSVS